MIEKANDIHSNSSGMTRRYFETQSHSDKWAKDVADRELRALERPRLKVRAGRRGKTDQLQMRAKLQTAKRKTAVNAEP